MRQCEAKDRNYGLTPILPCNHCAFRQTYKKNVIYERNLIITEYVLKNLASLYNNILDKKQVSVGFFPLFFFFSDPVAHLGHTKNNFEW